jgi:glutamyl-tRNA reductase
MHINLFLEERRCLVIGGGKVAFHKTELLLEAQAIVHVISPELTDEFKRLVQLNLVTHEPREFEPTDATDATIVYAATNSRGANRAILNACREKHILCCCVDGNWSNGDFTTPAITRHNQLMVSISSGGTNCRQSKLVKNSLGRHLEMLDAANLIIVGTDHHHLALEEREPFHLTGDRYERAGFMLMQLWGIHEFLLLNTCNRVEIIAVVASETAQNGILPHSMGFSSIKENKYYMKTGEKAFEHLCLVTAGMLSQTPGENHITAQIKDALETAKNRGWAGNMLQEWISSALFISKEIKNETSTKLETEAIALRYLAAKAENINAIMIIGTGLLGKGLVEESTRVYKKTIWCYHRNRPDLNPEWQNRVELISFNEIKNRLGEVNLIVSAANANGYILTTAHAPFFDLENSTHIVDLSMPRTIDPDLQTISADIQVLDLDGIKNWNRQGLCHFYDFLSNSRKITANHMHLYEKITHNFQGWNPSE